MRKTNNIMFDSCIFEGRVFHNRVYPKSHYFKYKVFCIYFDLCKIKEIFKKIPILSINKFDGLVNIELKAEECTFANPNCQ